MAGNNERQFRFGAIVHEDYRELAMLLPELEDRLNQNINLKDYTDRVERIYFAPILMPEGGNGLEEERSFDESKMQLLLKVKIDARKLKSLNETGFAVLISNALSNDLNQFQVLPPELVKKIAQVPSANQPE